MAILDTGPLLANYPGAARRTIHADSPSPLPPEREEVERIGTKARKPRQLTPRIRSAEREESGRVTSVENSAIPPVAALASTTERQSARELLATIGQRFAENRQKSKSKAFEIYQRDLATNSGVLVMGGAVTLKELTVLLMDLEGFVKSSQKEGETSMTILAQFLRGELEVE